MKFGMQEYTMARTYVPHLAPIGIGWVQVPPKVENLIKIAVYGGFPGLLFSSPRFFLPFL